MVNPQTNCFHLLPLAIYTKVKFCIDRFIGSNGISYFGKCRVDLRYSHSRQVN